jgi:hypothetical protein
MFIAIRSGQHFLPWTMCGVPSVGEFANYELIWDFHRSNCPNVAVCTGLTSAASNEAFTT